MNFESKYSAIYLGIGREPGLSNLRLQGYRLVAMHKGSGRLFAASDEWRSFSVRHDSTTDSKRRQG